MKKKILFVNGHLNVGGVEKSLTDLLRHLDYNKYEVDLLLLEDKGAYMQTIPKSVNIVFFDTTKAYGPLLKVFLINLFRLKWSVLLYRFVLLLAGIFGKSDLFLLKWILPLKSIYDVAIAYRPGICADIVAYTVKANKKVVWWHHGSINISSKQIIEYNKTWEHFNNVIAVSYGCKQLIANIFQCPSDKIIVIPNMVDIDLITNLAGKKSPYKNDGLNIISVGKLCIEKHFEDVISVTKRLVKDGALDFHWYIVGDGELREDLLYRIEESRISNRLTLLGKKENPYPWMKYADIFVHPSYVESQGLVVLEAMALGTPCVVCRSIGTSEFMIDEKNGILTEPNELSLYLGLNKMLRMSDKINLINEAKNMVAEKFNGRNIMQIFEKQIILNNEE